MVQRISPVLIYDDGDAGIRFLTEAFGFTEHGVYRTPEGAIAHAELTYDGGLIGLSERSGGERSIFDTGPCTIYVVVDDADSHHARAVEAGADVCFPLTDQEYGSRDYAVRDAEGFIWCFGTYAPGSDPSPALSDRDARRCRSQRSSRWRPARAVAAGVTGEGEVDEAVEQLRGTARPTPPRAAGTSRSA